MNIGRKVGEKQEGWWDNFSEFQLLYGMFSQVWYWMW